MVQLVYKDGSHPGLALCHGVVIDILTGFQDYIIVFLREVIGTECDLCVYISLDLK